MGQRVLIDTDVLIDYYKGRLELPPGNIYYISTMTLYEYIRGTRKPKEAKKLLEKSFVVIPMSNEIFLKSAEIWRSLKSEGILIDDRDLMIGVTALVLKLRLFTRNKKRYDRLRAYGLQFFEM